MNMIGHNAPGAKAVPLVIKAEECICHDVSADRVAQTCDAETAIEDVVAASFRVFRNGVRERKHYVLREIVAIIVRKISAMTPPLASHALTLAREPLTVMPERGPLARLWEANALAR